MNRKVCSLFISVFLIFLTLLPISLKAQMTVSPSQTSTPQADPNGAQQSAPQNLQTISQTGLLPVFAVDMQFDPSWVDGRDVPSKSPQYSHSGVSDTFQQAAVALKAGGFSTIRFPLEVADPQAALRLANLCLWGKANNMSLIPILKLAGDIQKDESLATAAGTFATLVVSRLRPLQQLPAYAQISYYQVEDTMNHGGLHPNLTPEVAAQTLLIAAEALRKSESQALQGSGVQATPIMISASFDYELIRQGGIAGVPLDAATEQSAGTSLKQFLTPFATAANIEAVNVEWFPRSISAGDVDHFAALLRQLKSALPDKQLILTTGFSSAFHTPDQQTQFLTLAVTNLADFRASDGVNSHFLGAVFRQAFSGPLADSKAPEGISDPTQWNWTEKCQQLSRMWSQDTKSAELSWWWNKVQDGMGLLALQPNGSGAMSVVALPGVQVFQQISTTVAQVSQQMASPVSASSGQPFVAPAAIPGVPQSTIPTGQVGAQSFVPPSQGPLTSNVAPTVFSPYTSNPNYPGGPAASAQQATAPFQQLFFTLLQQVTTQLSSSLVSKLTNSARPGMPSQYASYPGISAGQNMLGGSAAQNPYATPNYIAPNAANAPVSQPAYPPTNYPAQITNAPTTYPPQPGMPAPGVVAGAVSLSPQDVTVDTSSVVIGQAVHITAQIHNGSANKDVTGLTVQLVDPSSPLAPNQAMQNGISVPRLGMAPVLLVWTASASSTGQHLMLLQVLDDNGVQVATVALPAIVVMGGTGADTNRSTPPFVPPSNSFVAAPSTASPVVSGSVVSLPQPIVPPQIAFFGPADGNTAAVSGQLPTLSAQVVNPSDQPMTPVQAQLFVDGTPSVVQSTGPLLPKQTRSTMFIGVPAGVGSHSVTVVLTTADGGTASSTVSVVTAGGSSATTPGVNAPPTNLPSPNVNSSTAAIAPSQRQVGVRSGAPTSFAIGLTSTTATGGTLANSGASGSALGPQTVQPSPTVPVGTGPSAAGTAMGPANVAGPRPGPTGAAAAALRPPENIPSRPGPRAGKSPANPVSPNVPPRPGPTGGASVSSASGTPPRPGPYAARTPTTTADTPAPITGLPARPGPTTNMTNTTAPARPGAVVPVGAQAYVDLSVSVADIRLTPPSPQPGQPLSLVATVRNLGTLDAHGATVVFKLVADGRQVAISQPVKFDIAAHGAYPATWSASIPLSQATKGQALQLMVVVTGTGDVNLANNLATLSFTLPTESQARH